MDFRVSQALALSGVSTEAFRHWKTVLKPLSGRDGRGGGLPLGDVLCLSVLDRLVNKVGVQVSKLAPDAEELFDGVREHWRTRGRPPYLFFSGDRIAFGDLGDLPDHDAVVVIAISPILDELNRKLAGFAGQPRLL